MKSFKSIVKIDFWMFFFNNDSLNVTQNCIVSCVSIKFSFFLSSDLLELSLGPSLLSSAGMAHSLPSTRTGKKCPTTWASVSGRSCRWRCRRVVPGSKGSSCSGMESVTDSFPTWWATRSRGSRRFWSRLIRPSSCALSLWTKGSILSSMSKVRVDFYSRFCFVFSNDLGIILITHFS